ncbi:MAG: hypothetical protein H7Y13_10040 [Sphingobacteriaceae bacterium]|nr:hypothetical protein [Sphingobacteriaceae bacterium]
MKRILLYFMLFLPLFSLAQSNSSIIKIGKLVLEGRKSFYFSKGDSSASLIIDTLIMKDKSKLFFTNKKKINLVVNHAQIGKDCVIFGTDGKNNGTDLNLSMNFIALKSLYINVSGEEAKIANRHFDNGNGGQVVLNYVSGGKKPQTTDKRGAGYVSISNKAGGNLVNPQTDMAVIMDRLRNGTAGRPLGQFPQGRVYSGNMGRDGKATIKAVSSLPN